MEIFSKTGGTDLEVRRREIILVIGFIYFYSALNFGESRMLARGRMLFGGWAWLDNYVRAVWRLVWQVLRNEALAF
jgi:hypothetical protein